MQKQLGIVLTVLLLAVGLFFSATNHMEVVWEIPGLTATMPSILIRLPLYRFVFVLLTLGFAAGILVGWGSGLKYRRALQKLQRQHGQLEEELRNLRNLPLEQDVLL